MFYINFFSKSILLMTLLFISLNAQNKNQEENEINMHKHHTGYTSDVDNEIKALSENEINQYLSGAGMGLAKAAELNNYPGPKHVLDLKTELKLTKQQIKGTQKFIDQVKTEAIKLGKIIVQKEMELNSIFNTGSANEKTVSNLVTEIAELKGKLRLVHLNAHLKQKEILSNEQIDDYNKYRGYK